MEDRPGATGYEPRERSIRGPADACYPSIITIFWIVGCGLGLGAPDARSHCDGGTIPVGTIVGRRDGDNDSACPDASRGQRWKTWRA